MTMYIRFFLTLLLFPLISEARDAFPDPAIHQEKALCKAVAEHNYIELTVKSNGADAPKISRLVIGTQLIEPYAVGVDKKGTSVLAARLADIAKIAEKGSKNSRETGRGGVLLIPLDSIVNFRVVKGLKYKVDPEFLEKVQAELGEVTCHG
jgi:hypothetical protein